MSVRLSVNVNKIAYMRNTRDLNLPDVMHFVKSALEAGARGITVHPRPDGRHIRKEDVIAIAQFLQNHKDIEFNIEGNPFHPPLLELVEATRPSQATLVPDEPGASTSNHGWNPSATKLDELARIIATIKNMGARVSLFMDADPFAIESIAPVGADRIELYTEPFARAFVKGQGHESLEQFSSAAIKARELGLGVNAGHDLNLQNLVLFRELPGLLEVSIGHALTADALEMGWQNAIKAYLKALHV